MTSSSTGVSPHRAGTPHCHSAGDPSGETRPILNMSTGQRTHAAFIQGGQSTVEHEASHSALFYLLQEVSKLAPPIHSSFLDTNSPSTWLSETSRQGSFSGEREEEGAHLFKISNKSCQHSLSHLLHHNQMKGGQEESHDSKVTALMEPVSEHNSPWKVLSLINLQCERLLRPSDVEESDPSSLSFPDKLNHSTDKLLTATADVTDQGAEVDCVSVECTLRPPRQICERQVSSCAGPMEDMRVDCSRGASSYKPQCFVQSQTAGKTDAFGLLLEGNATASSQQKDKGEFSVNKQFEWNKECKMDCRSSECNVLNVLFSESASSQTHLPDASTDTQVTFNSNEDAGVTLSKPALTLDHNANLVSDTEVPPPSSILFSSQSASLLLITTEKHHLLSEQGDTASKPECILAPIEETSDAVSHLKSCISQNGETNPSLPATSEPETKCMQKEEISSSAQQWRSKTPRKQPHPSRSPDIQDPDFQGVTFRMDRELDDSREQCRLLITSKYSKQLCKSVRKPKMRMRASQRAIKTSSSDEESDPTTSISRKICASCCTRKTPMWRDAEDGTPLCNACGIRYKKYRVRCIHCWHIPRKEGNSSSCCLKCGNFVRLTSAQQKHTA